MIFNTNRKLLQLSYIVTQIFVIKLLINIMYFKRELLTTIFTVYHYVSLPIDYLQLIGVCQHC